MLQAGASSAADIPYRLFDLFVHWLKTRWFLSAQPALSSSSFLGGGGLLLSSVMATLQNQKSRGDKSGLLAGHGCLVRRLMTSPRTCSLASFWPWSWCALWLRLAGTAGATYPKEVACICARAALLFEVLTWVFTWKLNVKTSNDYRWLPDRKESGNFGLRRELNSNFQHK